MGRRNGCLFAVGGGEGGLGHIIKVAATPIYGKNFLKAFSGTEGPMTLGLDMHLLEHGPNKVCSNDDLGLILTFLGQCQIWFLVILYGKIYISLGKLLESHLMEEITYNK